jgi:hypothetical protein
MAAGGMGGRRQYRKVVNRGEGEEEGEESKYGVEESKRTIEEYCDMIKKNT